MTDTSKATPRPWKVEPHEDDDGVHPGRWVKSVDGRTIAVSIYGHSGEEIVANAALIVKAVNAYDAMRGALETAQAYLHQQHNVHDWGPADGCAGCVALAKITAALAKEEPR